MLRLKSYAWFVVLVFLVAATGAISASSDHNPTCPTPTVAEGGQCVLSADAVLTQTLRLPSGTKLNCKGHRLMPAAAGTLDDPRTVANEFQPSQPELAIILRGAYDTKIQNCHIDGFDFGILVTETKAPDEDTESSQTQNKILANTIDVRTNAITLLKSDRVLIADNQLTYAAERGRGVVVEFDSDENLIVNNTISSTDAASTGLVRLYPGGTLVTDSQIAVMDNEIHVLNATRPLQNVVVEGQLMQFVSLDPQATDLEDSGRSDHNLIEGNVITDVGVGATCTRDPGIPCSSNANCVGKGSCLLKEDKGIGFNFRAGDTTIRANLISGRMNRGISFAGNPSVVTLIFTPGICTLDANRRCIDNTDCNLAGFDQSPKGTCAGAAAGTVNGNSVRLIAEGNSLTGTFDGAALFVGNADDFTLRGNIVEGGGVTSSGIQLQSTAINGVIQRNVVNDINNALLLARPSALSWIIRLNDFTNYLTAVRTTNDYDLPTELGGNYWGLPCPGFDPGLARYMNNAINPYIIDAHAYGVPVAMTPNEQLPAPCQ